MTAKQKANQARFKAVAAEAKKLRKKNPSLSQAQAVKQAWAIMYGKKRIGENHKDTKSHNVNIRVVSGLYDYEKEAKKRMAAKKAAYNKKLKKAVISPIKQTESIDEYEYRNAPSWKKVSGWRKGSTAIIEENEGRRKGLKNVRLKRSKKGNIRKPGTFYRFSTLSGLFDTKTINDIDALKKQYFKLAKVYHPDAGGTTAQFQALQAEYEKLLQNLLAGSSLDEESKKNEVVIDKAIRDVIDQLVGIEDLNIELIGKWLWISGNTYPVRNTLKSAGLIFIKKEGKPYWVYKGVESAGRGKTSMDEIKRKYGVTDIRPSAFKKISGIAVAINRTKLKSALQKLLKGLNKRPV